MKPFYLVDDEVSNNDTIKKIEVVGNNCIICRKSVNNEKLEGIYNVLLTNQNNLEYEYKSLNNKTAIQNIKPVSYSILLTKIKKYFDSKQSKDFFRKKSDYITSEFSKQIKIISAIQGISLIASEILIEIRDNETINHMKRTQKYVKELAEFLAESKKYNKNLTKESIDIIVHSALIHDIGKIGIPQKILMKKERLSTEEFNIIKTHTTLGMEAIAWAEKLLGERETFLKHAKEIAYFHHEKWDGSGYPNGIKGYNIPLSARIMAVADVYDALTTERGYKDIIEHEAAVEIIIKNSGKHFDPDVVRAFIELEHRFKNISYNMKK